MASDVRECDVCGTVFKIGEAYYDPLTLPMLVHLGGLIEQTKNRIKDKSIRLDVPEAKYDVCNHCLLRLCEVLQGIHSIREEQRR